MSQHSPTEDGAGVSREARDTLTHALQVQLAEDIRRIHVADNHSAARRALSRLDAVAEHAPAFVVLLAEPWLGAGSPTRTLQILTDSVRVHLYARILDDALDENLPVYRQNLLRAQPLFWQTVQRIGSLGAPEIAQQATELIHDTIESVQYDDVRRDPQYWGLKNHHMLLAPLLLSNNAPQYQRCKPALSRLIALVQAGDELRQGEFADGALHGAALAFITASLNTEQLALLDQCGWKDAAQRMVWNAQQLIGALADSPSGIA